MTSPAGPAPGSSDGPDSLTVTYEVTQGEQVRGGRNVMNRLVGTWAGYGALLLLPTVDWWTKRGRWQPDGLTLFLALVGAGAAALLYLNPWLVARRIRRQFPQPDGPFTLALERPGFAFTSSIGRSEFVWTFLKEVRENDEFLFLHVSKSQAFVVPKRALSPAELDAFWWVLGRWAPHVVRHSRRA